MRHLGIVLTDDGWAGIYLTCIHCKKRWRLSLAPTDKKKDRKRLLKAIDHAGTYIRPEAGLADACNADCGKSCDR